MAVDRASFCAAVESPATVLLLFPNHLLFSTLWWSQRTSGVCNPSEVLICTTFCGQPRRPANLMALRTPRMLLSAEGGRHEKTSEVKDRLVSRLNELKRDWEKREAKLEQARLGTLRYRTASRGMLQASVGIGDLGKRPARHATRHAWQNECCPSSASDDAACQKDP
jgi:hypothetical protein